jgi:hypothetical protein
MSTATTVGGSSLVPRCTMADSVPDYYKAYEYTFKADLSVPEHFPHGFSVPDSDDEDVGVSSSRMSTRTPTRMRTRMLTKMPTKMSTKTQTRITQTLQSTTTRWLSTPHSMIPRWLNTSHSITPRW